VWVVFDEVAAEDWYVGAERVSEMKKRMGLK
jgi:phenylpyruvate tautomerase PptA (4-oxalocrotonate tautomerase family)